tara:strand:- start:564 stop:881 length:318 start_codon:yes stop_codon:yes gene_type:complete
MLSDIRQRMRAIMSQHVSIVRNATGLNTAQKQLKVLLNSLEEVESALAAPEGKRLYQALQLARLTVLAAQQRHESRGLHYTTDWPKQQPIAAASTLTLQDLEKRR